MNDTKLIPFLDLVTPHKELRAELLRVFENTLDSAGFIGGPMVQGFEQDFATFCESQYCVGVGSGTDALRFALVAAGLTHADLVITVAHTFIATTEAISQAGGGPMFVDIDQATYNMDPVKLRQYIEVGCDFDRTKRTLVDRKSKRRVAAVVPVHLYGQMADMDPILELAEQYNLIVIEDACQAHGAEYFSKKQNRWCRAGSMGAAAAFSFYPGKNLGACGEAGAVTTNREDLAQTVRLLRDHGQPRKYYHEIEGFNGRLDAMQAGILQVKLRHLTDWNEKRAEAADRYRELFQQAGYDAVPYVPEWARSVYHLYVIRSKQRDALIQHLAAYNIGVGIHYPVPLHLQGAYRTLSYAPGDLPVTEQVAAEVLSLPMFPGLCYKQQERIVEGITSFDLGLNPEKVSVSSPELTR